MEPLSLSLAADAAADIADFLQEAEKEEEEEEKSEHSGQGLNRAKRGRGRQVQAKAVAKVHVKKKGKPSQADAGWKKCKQCATWKEDSDYNNAQARCKACFNDNRSLRRLAERQNAQTDLDEMERDDPKQHAALVKAVKKERDLAKKTGQKMKFSIASFKIKYKTQSGVRGEKEGEMMWEGEWLEEAKKAKHGFLSDQEARALWLKWDSDPEHPRDSLGPRNYPRLWVKVRDKLTYYDDLSRSKELEKEEKLGKKPSQATIDARLKMLGGDAGLEDHEMTDFGALQSKAGASFAGKAGTAESALSGDGLFGPDVEQVLAAVKSKMKKRRVACAGFTIHCQPTNLLM